MNDVGLGDELSQMRDVVDVFNTITDRCFQDCVYNFRTKKLVPQEKKCVLACSEKWIGATQRITRTFVEQQWLQGQQKAQEQQQGKQ